MWLPASEPPASSPPDPTQAEHAAGAEGAIQLWTGRLERDPAFVSRQIADETILVPIRQNMGDLESVYSLNEVGTRVWELLDGCRTMAEVRDLLLEEFEVGRGELERDLLDLLRQLQAVRAVRPATPPAGGGRR